MFVARALTPGYLEGSQGHNALSENKQWAFSGPGYVLEKAAVV